MSIPFLGEIVAGLSVRELQIGIYDLMANLQVPDFSGTLDPQKEREFRAEVLEGARIAKWWMKFMWGALRGNLWSDPGVALEFFEEWVSSLEKFCSDDTLEEIEHTAYCVGTGCFKYSCAFHYFNSELSLKVFNNYLDYERFENGQLKSVWYLPRPFY